MRVTSKGQVTIPQNVRETLGITPKTEIQFVEDNGKFYLVKVGTPEKNSNFSKLRGIATAKMSTDESAPKIVFLNERVWPASVQQIVPRRFQKKLGPV